MIHERECQVVWHQKVGIELLLVKKAHACDVQNEAKTFRERVSELTHDSNDEWDDCSEQEDPHKQVFEWFFDFIPERLFFSLLKLVKSVSLQ